MIIAGERIGLNDGSYGCVNLRPSDAPKVWDNVEKNEAVIIYK